MNREDTRSVYGGGFQKDLGEYLMEKGAGQQ